ncbi:MAG TPA: sigma-70 family RNA polymerase sigma factor [Steroidobacter sp.]|uniref:RNA polymerase sigma factor n=1 Tax=Steroidobacter sp. TaxID=1978227 RepID=UPI002EDBA747
MGRAVDGSSDQWDQSTAEAPVVLTPLDAHCSRNDRVAEWFGRWRKYIRKMLRRRMSVPRADIDDLAQEVFLRVLRYGDPTEIKNPGGYLARVTANVANEWCGKARMRYPHDDCELEELLSEGNDHPEIALAQTQRMQRVQAAIARLPARRREVLLSRMEDDMTCNQIAEHLGLSRRIVLRDLNRAYDVLRTRLKREDL